MSECYCKTVMECVKILRCDRPTLYSAADMHGLYTMGLARMTMSVQSLEATHVCKAAPIHLVRTGKHKFSLMRPPFCLPDVTQHYGV